MDVIGRLEVVGLVVCTYIGCGEVVYRCFSTHL